MSRILPMEAESHVDLGSQLVSLRKLADAVERGEVELSALVNYAKTVSAGDKPRFAKTRPLPLAMLKAIRSKPDEPPRKIVYAGVASGAWTMEDAEAYELNEEALSTSRKKAVATRGVYVTKARRPERRLPQTQGMFVPKMALDVFCRKSVSDGAKACLSILLALAGKGTTITTYTSSIAEMMGRTPRSVRNYFIALEEAGLIVRTPGTHFNTVRIELSAECRPEAYVEPDDIKAFKTAKASPEPSLRHLALSIVVATQEVHPEVFSNQDRRKDISVFNPLSESFNLQSARMERRAVEKGEVVAGLSYPTTHSTLLLDRRRPINGERGQNLPSRSSWMRPNQHSTGHSPAILSAGRR